LYVKGTIVIERLNELCEFLSRRGDFLDNGVRVA